MDYSDDEHSTPRFGNCIDYKTSFEEFLSKKIRKSSSGSTQNLEIENEEKYKKNERSKNKKRSRNKSKEKRNSSGKYKNESKEENKNKINFLNKNKNYFSGALPIEEKYKNPFDIFIKKRIKLRNDFDQINSEKLLFEKELAFQQFQMDENADYLDG